MALTDRIEKPRKILPVIFLVDTSANMAGGGIIAINKFMENAIIQLKELHEYNSDADIEIAVLKTSPETRWVTDGLVDINSINRKDFKAEGEANIGAAYKALNEKLSVKNGFMKEVRISCVPCINLISNGDFTSAYEKSLDELKQNDWYKMGIKTACAFGDLYYESELAKFTGHKEQVIKENHVNTFIKMIKFFDAKYYYID